MTGIPVRFLALVGVLSIAGVGAAAQGGAAYVSQNVAARSSACAASSVRYRGGSISGVPWVPASPSARHAAAYLFYFSEPPFRQTHPRTAVIPINGRTADGSTKILWLLPGGTAMLRISGRQQDGTGTFTQLAHRALGGLAQYPSITKVPRVGCWQITIRSGAAAATITMKAIRLSSP